MEISNTPKVSIGLPVFNGAEFLRNALDSIVAQTYSDFEVVISDNASTDATPEICREFAARDPRIKYHRSETNQGAAWNFNNTFKMSCGEYFRWAAHDDTLHPEFLNKCVTFLDANDPFVLCYSRTEFIDENNNKIKEFAYPIDVSAVSRKRLFMYYVGAHHINSEIFGLMRSEILRKTRLIDGFVGSDFVLLGELVLHGSFHKLPEVLFSHREHSGRSTKITKDPEEYTEWFDSSKKVKFTMPFTRRLYECSRSVARHPMRFSRKMEFYFEICRAAKWNWKGIIAEFLRAVKMV